MEASIKPDIVLAQKVLPGPLFKSLDKIFSQNISNCMLVGGTALSGFYAGHRRSDDIDLFVQNETAFTQTVLAFKTLKDLGTEIDEKSHSKQYYRALCNLEDHHFTVDIVIDANLFEVGKYTVCGSSMAVAELNTIFMMKAGTLVSRASEKDLYDLMWLFRNMKGLKISDIMTLGKNMDAGLNPETVLYNISSTPVTKQACDFSLDPELDAGKIFSRINRFKKALVQELQTFLKQNTNSELITILKKIADLK